MKWSSTFEDITIIPETEEDKVIIEKLKEALTDVKAGDYYNFGNIELDDDNITFVR